MTHNEALILGKIAQNMREIKALSGLLSEEVRKEVEESFVRFHYPVSFQDFIMLELISLDVAAKHGHRDLISLVDLLSLEAGVA